MRNDHVQPRRYFALLCAVYFLILGVTAPATLLQPALSAQSGITLAHLAGTLWHGSAGELVIPTKVGMIQVNDVQWEVQWRYLLRGEIALKLETADAVGSLTLARGFSRLRVAQADLALPAADLAQHLPQLSLWQPEGEVQFQTQGFALNSLTPSEAIVCWRNATLNLSTIQPLGDYRLQLHNTDGKINVRLETQGGKLRLEGIGAYSKPGGLRFAGSAHADPSYAQQLQALLALLGRDRGDGVHVFSLHLQ